MRKWTLAAALVALTALVPRALAAGGFPEPITERARIIEGVYTQIFIAGVIIFVIVVALLAFVLIRFREGSGKGRATFEKERDNLKAEATWTIIPLIIVLWVGVISYNALAELDNLDNVPAEDALELDVTAVQYAWIFQYPSGVQVVASANEDLSAIEPIFVPADTPLLLRVTANDVIHSLNIVELRETLDAVPGQINELLVREGLPAGEYFTQCKEDCLTPGHSYMQAVVHAVPQAEFDQWEADQLAGAGAGLEQIVPLQFDGTDLEALQGDLLAKGATATVQFTNADSVPHTFTFRGADYEVPANGLESVEFTVEETGDSPVTTETGASLTLTAVEPEVRTIGLGAFVIEPENFQVDAGKLYVFNVENTHGAVHNLYIGMDGADGNTDAIWHTADLGPGQSQSILVAPQEPSTLDTWCAIPGHYGLGMYGTMTVV